MVGGGRGRGGVLAEDGVLNIVGDEVAANDSP